MQTSPAGDAKDNNVHKTEIIRDVERIRSATQQTISNAKTSLSAYTGSAAPEFVMGHFKDACVDLKKRGVRIRLLTEITKDNIKSSKELLEFADLRHLKDTRWNFLVTESEYLATSTLTEDRPIPYIIYSNVREMVEQSQSLFDSQWAMATPAYDRIREIVDGIVPEETRVIRGVDEILQTGIDFIDQAKSEVMIIFASENRVNQSLPLLEVLSQKSERQRVRVRILAPVAGPESMLPFSKVIRWRGILPTPVALLLVDGAKMLMVQYSFPENVEKEQIPSLGIVSTHKQTIAGVTSIFEALWFDSELRHREEESRLMAETARQREERSRRQSELLQDILAHDIANYNQASRLAAEMLQEELTNNYSAQTLVADLIRAIDGSTQLITKARKLGKILSETNPSLFPTSIRDSIERALLLLERANPEKRVMLSYTEDKQLLGARVLADELLDEIFVNVLSNAIKYTDGQEVAIEVSLQDEVRRVDQHFLSISIADHGSGMPDEIKDNLFARYKRGARGSGLGLSIAYALATDRYHGEMSAEDRVKGDHSKGTVINISVPMAD